MLGLPPHGAMSGIRTTRSKPQLGPGPHSPPGPPRPLLVCSRGQKAAPFGQPPTQPTNPCRGNMCSKNELSMVVTGIARLSSPKQGGVLTNFLLAGLGAHSLPEMHSSTPERGNTLANLFLAVLKGHLRPEMHDFHKVGSNSFGRFGGSFASGNAHFHP